MSHVNNLPGYSTSGKILSNDRGDKQSGKIYSYYQLACPSYQYNSIVLVHGTKMSYILRVDTLVWWSPAVLHAEQKLTNDDYGFFNQCFFWKLQETGVVKFGKIMFL